MTSVDQQPVKQDFAAARKAMIDSQLRVSGVNAENICERMAAVPRENFVPDAARGFAYMDRSIPLGGGRFLAAPLVQGKMLEEAAPTLADRVLLVDGGSGYLAELLRPLVTRHTARRFKADMLPATRRRREILYPHVVVNGRREAADLGPCPNARAYLERHRGTLEARSYLIAAGRRWYELWVPQDPAAWSAPKLVFPDISEKPVFWMDTEGGVVNGECYWLQCEREHEEDLLWLGLRWDETDWQSRRSAIHERAAAKLKADGRLYPAYETQTELDRRRKVQLSRGQPPIYDRAALKLTEDEKKALEASLTNAADIAKFLAGANPNWTEGALNGALAMHVNDHKLQVDQMMSNAPAAEQAKSWEGMQKHMDMIADVLADGIAKQFPDKAN